MRTRSHSFIRRLGIAGAILVLAMALAACSQTQEDQAPANSLTGINWEWTSLTVQPSGATTNISDPAAYTLVFNEDGTLTGRADCNNFTGTYSQTNGFVITLGASTAAACGDESLDQEYLALLSSVVAGGPDGQGNLALENAGGEKRMLFRNGGAPSN